MNISDFLELPLMGILRGIREKDIPAVFECALESGLRTIEITMNTPGAGDLLEKACRRFSDHMNIGAGTVLKIEELNSAVSAGAEFIVSPVFSEEIVSSCKERSIPCFPGALTPHEIYRAWDNGASIVKLYPAKIFGPAYIKEVKSPLDKISIMACGGVSPENISDYISSGADAVAAGASMFKKDMINSGDYKALGKIISLYVSALKTAIQ